MSGNPGPTGAWKTDTTTVSQEALLVVISEKKVSVSVSLASGDVKSTTVSRTDGKVISSE